MAGATEGKPATEMVSVPVVAVLTVMVAVLPTGPQPVPHPALARSSAVPPLPPKGGGWYAVWFPDVVEMLPGPVSVHVTGPTAPLLRTATNVVAPSPVVTVNVAGLTTTSGPVGVLLPQPSIQRLTRVHQKTTADARMRAPRERGGRCGLPRRGRTTA